MSVTLGLSARPDGGCLAFLVDTQVDIAHLARDIRDCSLLPGLPFDREPIPGPIGNTKETHMSTPCPPTDGSAQRQVEFSGPPEMCIDPSKTYTAVLDTSLGSITIALDAAAAPRTVNNFVVLARYRYYEGIIFHRIIPDFMCQGGDPTGSGRGGPGYRFEDELPAPGTYQIGSVAMANAGPDTNGSQFFLVSGRSGVGLPPQYSLFGQITEGLDVLETMQNVPTDRGDRPNEDVVINSVTITES